MGLFLETATQLTNSQAAGLFALGTSGFILVFLLAVGMYIYISFAYMAIARKNNQSSPGLAWIPGVGPMIVAYRASKMHWWPWLLLIGVIIPVVNIFAMVAFVIFAVIWHWKMFEAVNKPGWWAIFFVIPILNIVFYVFIGIAAWSSD